ncbi:hypothetical protein SLEP1_g45836 [Rubroshorea leprosula]|uniref:Uncharacterized protein n=1 Tax=Rubroshorea leprosula TaxID=152421 RepID=A0AAV5LKE6_9ROSI|nr:hypothetical protein SLEP1_g45836 [Rubroshorea leprosula]
MRGLERECFDGGGSCGRGTIQHWERFRTRVKNQPAYEGINAREISSRRPDIWGYDRRVSNQATVFFFTNFPDDWKQESMWQTFRKFGRILDIYSPLRKLRKGSRFGPRFKGKESLKSSYQGHREKEGVGVQRTYAEVVKGKLETRTAIENGKQVKREKEHWQIQNSNPNRNPVQIWRVKDKKQVSDGIEFTMKEEEYSWLQGCYVGMAHSVEIIPTLQEKFFMEGYFSCKVRAMGGCLVLLEGGYKEEIKDLVEMAPECSCLGSKFFAIIGTKWGKFITRYDSTSKKQRFDIGRMLISTSEMDFISKNISIKVNDEPYTIKGMEEEATDGKFSMKSDHVFKELSGSDDDSSESWSLGNGLDDELNDAFLGGGNSKNNWNTTGEKKDDNDVEVEEEKGMEAEIGDEQPHYPDKEVVPDSSEAQNTQNMEKSRMRVSIGPLEMLNPVEIGETWANNNNGPTKQATPEIGDSRLSKEKTEEAKVKQKEEKQILLFGIYGGRKIGTGAQVEGEEESFKRAGNEGQNVEIFSWIPQSSCSKRVLWSNIKELLMEEGGCWCLMGDFNAIRSEYEWNGGRSNMREMAKFDEFIRECGLIDLPLIGRKYTWYQPNEEVMSRLDRFLLSEDWCLKWGDLKQWGLKRAKSYHCPILMKNLTIDWGPKPFRFFDVWLNSPGCKEIVEEVWSSTLTSGWYGYRLKEKLKATKKALKVWSRNMVSETDSNIKRYEESIAAIDLKGEVALCLKKWKAWIKDGDANTSFFHRCVKGRRRQNEIVGIQVGDKYMEQVDEIKEGVANYFQNLFTEERWQRPHLDGLEFKKISAEDNLLLLAPFNKEEVKQAVWSCEGSKALGPDGFNFNFIREMWDLIKGDVMGFEFRPIFLIEVMYKVIAKLLANRISSVLDSIIGESQMAFIRGRQMVDSIAISNETIDAAKRNKKASFVFKLDFEKAYDKRVGGLIGCRSRAIRDLYGEGTYVDKEKRISQMGIWRGKNWQWTLHWRRSLYEWEEDNLSELQRLIMNTHPTKDQKDCWNWRHTKEGEYSVKTAYALLSSNNQDNRSRMHERTWSKLIPTKISAFGWQVLQDRIPTKLNLYKRGIITDPNQLMCGFCGDNIEDANHLFLHCRVAFLIKSKCAQWWRFISVQLKTCHEGFEQHKPPAKDPAMRAGWDVIWFSTIWSLWMARNAKSFRNHEYDADRNF